MAIKPIRRTREQRERAAAKAAAVLGIKWIVYARREGTRELQGLFWCPNEARAVARHINRTERCVTWTEQVGGQ